MAPVTVTPCSLVAKLATIVAPLECSRPLSKVAEIAVRVGPPAVPAAMGILVYPSGVVKTACPRSGRHSEKERRGAMKFINFVFLNTECEVM